MECPRCAETKDIIKLEEFTFIDKYLCRYCGYSWESFKKKE
jgi:transposase-like protein